MRITLGGGGHWGNADLTGAGQAVSSDGNLKLIQDKSSIFAGDAGDAQDNDRRACGAGR